jgi:hypothetical protein
MMLQIVYAVAGNFLFPNFFHSHQSPAIMAKIERIVAVLEIIRPFL